jgi:uncharacterized delta-60 repeat protein
MKKIKLSILFLFAAFFINAQNGLNDPTFNTFDNGIYGNGYGFNSTVRTTSLQPDGKIIAGGDFSSFNGTSKNFILRLNVDGSIDSTFHIGNGFNNAVYTTSLQADGKIIVGGMFTSYNGVSRNNIVRLNTDGSIDPTFDPGIGFNDIVRTICIQPDGKIIAGGSFTSFNGVTSNRIKRLNPNGSVDAAFNIGSGFDQEVYSINVSPNGKIIVGGGFTTYNGTSRNRIVRLNTNGSIDAAFIIGSGFSGLSYYVLTTDFQVDGKIIAGGFFDSYNGVSRNGIVRLNADGSIDASFNPGTGTGFVLTTKTQSDGKIIVGGFFTSFNGMDHGRIVRLDSNGTVDTGFNTEDGFNDGVHSINIQTDGKIIVAGNYSSYDYISIRPRIVRLNNDGFLEAGTFNFGTGFNDQVFETAIQTDGKILVIGEFNSYNGVIKNGIARLNTDGSIDSTFNSGTGFSNHIGYTNDVATIIIQPDGKIIAGGNFTIYNGIPVNKIVRLNTDGSIDPTFDPGGGFDYIVLSTNLQSDGKIVAVGNFTSFNGVPRNRVVRLNTDGSIDPTFDPGSGFNYDAYSCTIQTDGKILIGGAFNTFNGSPVNRMVRLNSDGTLDASFNTGTGFNNVPGYSSNVRSCSIQPDGKIIIGGEFTSYDGTPAGRIVRLNTDGSIDPSFDTGSGFSGGLWSTLIQPDGKIITTGGFISFNGIPRNFIARLNPDGSNDATFNIGQGANTIVYSSNMQSDGKIILVGNFYTFNGVLRTKITRLLNCDSPATRTDVVHHSCPFTWIDGNVYTSGTTTATFTIPGVAANDCDSIITLNLTIEDSIVPIPDMATLPDLVATCAVTTLIPPTATDNCGGTLSATHNATLPITFQGTSAIIWTYDDGNGNTTTQTQNIVISAMDNSVSQTDLVLTANYSGQSYQWIDCGNGNTPLPGETNQTYTASENGTYAVIITNGICTDTSACTLIDFVGIEKLTDPFNVTAYPNPTNGTLTINASEIILSIQIQTIIGQEVNHIQNIEQGNYQLNLPVDSGVYLLVVTTKKGSKLLKVIKN